MREVNGHRHIRWRLSAGKTDHRSLVPCADVSDVVGHTLAPYFFRHVHAGLDVRRLFIEGDNDATRLVVEAIFIVRVTSVAHGITHDFLYIDIGAGRDLARDEY